MYAHYFDRGSSALHNIVGQEGPDKAATAEGQDLRNEFQAEATVDATDPAKMLQSSTKSLSTPTDASHAVEAHEHSLTSGSHFSGSRYIDDSSYSNPVSQPSTNQDSGSRHSSGAKKPSNDSQAFESSQPSEEEDDWYEHRYLADVARVPPKRARNPINYYAEDAL